ncbi:integrator complex subunit 10-like [Gigantopelta aegis]|uniref:integrator complex subunit 10-like n=1 Tax=Gigantopelta aegis TaxID=1735272 RepID=UPI001B88C7DC|nr:integrator complex subunit 10-like [Gigantopelta aegis]
MRARGYSKTDHYSAKAWLITARSLYPRCFLIQFESYQLEKSAKNVKDAAKLLEDMLKNFPNESYLWAEVHTILATLQADGVEPKTSFLTEIFAAIPTHIQCRMLLNVAEKIVDVLERCRLLLLAMKKFPDLVSEHGLKLVEMLSVEEKKAAMMSPVNCYRKLLVCDTLPLILEKGRHLDMKPCQLYTWLQRAIEFYVSYITQPASSDTPLSPDLLSPSKSCKKSPAIPGLLARESQIGDPWSGLFRLLQLVSSHLGWDIESDLFTKSKDYQWHFLLNVFNHAKQAPSSESSQKQILFMSTVVFLQCLNTYISSLDSDTSQGGLRTPVVLVEGFTSESDEVIAQPKPKRLRSEPVLPQIQPSPSIGNSGNIIENFLTAMKCFELLHSSEELRREFIGLCQNWRVEMWSWMSHFQTDMFIYQGAFQDAVGQLQNFITGAQGKTQVRVSLQLASCFYCLRKFSKACELLLDVLTSLPDGGGTSETAGQRSQGTSGQGRQLLLMQCTESEVLPYCIQLIITCLKDRIFSAGQCTDMILGHLIILLQFDWPRYEGLFTETVAMIQKQGSFTYNLFFVYIYNLDMLEEFAFLDTKQGGSVKLDILPATAKTIAPQRTVTRGVNKNVREDFKASLEKQLKKTNEPINQMIHTFLKEERTLLLDHLG